MVYGPPGGTAAGPGLSPERRVRSCGEPCEPPCLEERRSGSPARWVSSWTAFMRSSWMVGVCSGDGNDSWLVAAAGRRFEPQSPRSWLRCAPVAPAVTSTGSVPRHTAVSVRGEAVSPARWKIAGSTGTARLADVGRENPAEREPDLTVARQAGQALRSAARAGASGLASPAGGGRPGSSLQWPGRARRG